MNQNDRNFFNAALKKMCPPERLNATQALVRKSEETVEAVKQHLRAIIKAGAGFPNKGKEDLLDMAGKIFVGEYGQNYSRDEVVNLLAIMFVGEISNWIDSDPAGTGKPDALSGIP